MTSINFDVLIIGTGIAGLTTALKLAESNLKVAIITRESKVEESNTFWAQGGIIYAKTDDHSLLDDIRKASGFTSNIKAAEILLERSAKILDEILLEKVKTNFELESSGSLKKTKEGAHTIPRIIFKGDFTGKAIELSLLEHVKDKNRYPNITFLCSHVALDLITPGHHGVKNEQRYEPEQVVGAYALNQKTKDVIKIMAKKTVLATGGIGALYLHHTNSEGARGDGHAMAKRAGAVLTDMEYIQFHPTTFHDSSGHRRFLISEAVRGEGGILLNSEGVAFMEKYHPDKELAPRDVVARSIVEEMVLTNHDCVYLDITHKDPEWVKNRFPTIYEHCFSKHVDITKEPIPVVPAAHYSCGGVKVDLESRTTLKNLYAVGEVACSGLHGANRLASTSLLEGLTFGYIAAESISSKVNEDEIYPDDMIKDWKKASGEYDSALIHQDWMTLKQTMWNYVGITRGQRKLKRAKAMLSELDQEITRFYKYSALTDKLIGLRNAVTVAQMVQHASLINSNSVGCFYRED